MFKGTLSLLVAGAAAYGAYRYSKMSQSEKEALRSRGKDFLNKNLGDLEGMFGRKTQTGNTPTT